MPQMQDSKADCGHREELLTLMPPTFSEVYVFPCCLSDYRYLGKGPLNPAPNAVLVNGAFPAPGVSQQQPSPAPLPHLRSCLALSKPRTFLLTILFVFIGSYGLLPMVYNGSLGPSIQCSDKLVAPSGVSVASGAANHTSIYDASSASLSSTMSVSLLRPDLLHRVRFPRTKRRLPQCIIIGVRKCGTRALLEFLNLHPHIVKATQEVHFFDEDSKYSLGLEWYRRKMPYSFEDQITVEKSPSYFVTAHVPHRIFAMNPAAKLLLIVREPITRAVSDYTQIQANKMAKGKTYDAFESLALTTDGRVNVDYKALQISLYANFLRHWFEVFPRRQLHVVDGDTLITDPLLEIRKIEDFLGLEHRIARDNFYFNKTKGFFCLRNATTEKCLSEAKGRKHPQVSEQVVEKLKRFFATPNEQFFEMVGQNFSWPRPQRP